MVCERRTKKLQIIQARSKFSKTALKNIIWEKTVIMGMIHEEVESNERSKKAVEDRFVDRQSKLSNTAPTH